MSVVHLGNRCRMAASNYCLRMRSSACRTVFRLFAILPSRYRQSLVPAAMTNRENVGVVCGNCGYSIGHQRRFRHFDDSDAKRNVVAPPLPPDVFNRTVTIPKEVIECLVPATTGTGSINTGRVTYNAVWMRENCRCSKCHNCITEQRNVVFHRLGAQAFDVLSVAAAEDKLMAFWFTLILPVTVIEPQPPLSMTV